MPVVKYTSENLRYVLFFSVWNPELWRCDEMLIFRWFLHCVKSVQIRSFLYLRIQSEYRKIRTRKTPYLNNFHAVFVFEYLGTFNKLKPIKRIMTMGVYLQSFMFTLRSDQELFQIKSFENFRILSIFYINHRTLLQPVCNIVDVKGVNSKIFAIVTFRCSRFWKYMLMVDFWCYG